MSVSVAAVSVAEPIARARQLPAMAKWVLAGALVLLPVVLARIDAMSEFQALMLSFGCVYAIAALSVNLLTGYAGQVSLGHAAFIGIGAYASGWVTWTHERPFLLGLLAAAVIGGLTALIVGFPALRIRGLNLALLTLAFGLAMAAMVFRLRAVTGSSAGLPLPRPNINGYILTDNREYLAVAVAALVGVVCLDRNLLRTKLGRAMLALRENEDVASSFGVDVAWYKLLAFALSGAIAGIAGAIFGHLIGIAQVESFNFQLSMTLVVITVLGGLGSRGGVIAAGLFFGIAPRAFGFLEGWDLVIGPALVALTLARHPGGLAQQVRELRDRRRHREPDGPADALPLSFRITSPHGGSEPTHIEGLPPLIVEDLHVSFGGLTAVDGLSFRAEPGVITGIIGPNGAGKSTVFNAVSGFSQPSAGRILVGGVDVSTAPAHARAAAGLGRTFQLVGLIKSMTVRDNVMLAQHLHTQYRPWEALSWLPAASRVETELRTDADEVVCALGFERFLDTRLGNLSHGQQRIVEIACALATRPKVLLLDEPTAGLSPAAAEALAERLLDVRDRLGQTIALIEHHIPFVTATCTAVTVMASGRELTSGTPAEVLAHTDVVSAYLGDVA